MSKEKKELVMDSPAYEKKSKFNFAKTLIISFIAGGIAGFCLVFGCDIISDLYSRYHKSIRLHFTYAQLHILPWVMLACTIMIMVFNQAILNKSKKQVAMWDREDNDYIRKVDKQLSIVSMVASSWTILSFVLFAVISYNLNTNLEGIYTSSMVLVSVVVFLGGLLLVTVQQDKVIKQIKEYAPEKKGSVYDKKFQEIWYNSCDEAERYMICAASYQTHRFMNKLLSALLAVTTISGIFFKIGIICVILVGFIWLAMSLYYCITSMKIEYDGTGQK